MWPWYDIEMFESNHGLQKCQISTSHPGDWHDYNIATWNVLASLIDSWKVFIPKCVKTLRSFLLTWRLVQRKDTVGNTFLFAKSSQLRAAEVWCQGMWMFHLHRTTRTPHACLPPELVNLFAASSLQTWFRTSSLKLVSFEHLVPKWGGKKQFVRINKRAKTLVKVLDVCVPPSQSPYSPDCQAEEPMGELTFCVAKVKRSDCLSPEVQRVLTKISAALHLVISVFGMKWLAHTANPQISPIVAWQEFSTTLYNSWLTVRSFTRASLYKPFLHLMGWTHHSLGCHRSEKQTQLLLTLSRKIVRGKKKIRPLCSVVFEPQHLVKAVTRQFFSGV